MEDVSTPQPRSPEGEHPPLPEPAPTGREAVQPNVTDTAFVFEGGGMRASYTSALVDLLLAQGIHAEFVSGISAGSSLTVNYLSQDRDRVRRSFVDFAADPQFGSLRTFVQGKGLFHAEYIYQHAGTEGADLPFDWGVFRQNPARFAVAGFEAETGRTVWWGRQDVPTLEDLMIRVRASSTMPVVMPPVTIEGRTYVDGALGEDGGIPLSAAEAAGHERFLVVLTRPREYEKHPERFPGFYRRHFREHPAVAEALTTRWRRYNATRERVFRLEAEGRAYVFAPERMPVSNGERSVPRLAASYARGRAQALRELPAIRAFLGL